MSRWMVIALLAAPPVLYAAQEPPTLESIVALLQEGRAEAAESELEQILATSESAAARDLLGVALSRQGRLEEAERQFSRAAVLAPEMAAPKEHLGRLFLQQGRTEDALTELRLAAERAPIERDLALWLADAELSRGNPSAAENLLRSVVERFQSVRAMLRLTRLYGGQGENARAAETVQQALEIAPNSEQVLAARAKVSLAIEAPVVAIQALEALTRMHPSVAEYEYLLGVARLQIGEMAGSVESLRRSLELEPGRPLPLIALGATLNSQKRFAEARDVARQAVRLDPEGAEAMAALAEAEEGLGEVGAAEEHALQALTGDPGNGKALAVIGRIRMSQGRYGEARDLFLKALESMPRSAKTHYQLSLAFARLGDRETSRQHRELYQRFRQEDDERLIELRTRAGLGNEGMRRP